MKAKFASFTSRGNADFSNRVLSAMRHQFGGHVEKSSREMGEPHGTWHEYSNVRWHTVA